ncbi:hypothetical protein LCGC14_1049020 [marine sediment metagenome]|uniref:Helix-turn-helix domain-containing protein n=1 Tax=marine sediment metagenome TaxID=412755 RepID=A0A0F9NB93_9ZZZZ
MMESSVAKKEKQRTWHQAMTAERRCHWCGGPSVKEYANACEVHLEFVRGHNRRSKQKQQEHRVRNGLCCYCGKRPSRAGRSTCGECLTLKARFQREKRLRLATVKVDLLMDRGLIRLDEAAARIGVHRTQVHRLIRYGVLRAHRVHVREHGAHGAFWLEERQVEKCRATRLRRLGTMSGKE